MPAAKKRKAWRGVPKVFVSYSHKDSRRRDELEEHLAQLMREKLINVWWDGLIDPATPWDDDIKKHLRDADIVLVLISARFLKSYYCCEIELAEAARRHIAKRLKRKEKRAMVIPIPLSPCDWHTCLAGQFNPIPKAPKCVNGNRDHRDKRWTEVAKYIRSIVE